MEAPLVNCLVTLMGCEDAYCVEVKPVASYSRQTVKEHKLLREKQRKFIEEAIREKLARERGGER